MFDAGISLEADCFYFFTDRLNEDLSTRLAVTNTARQVLYIGKRDALESKLGFELKLPEGEMLFVLSVDTDRELYAIDKAYTLMPLSVDDLAPVPTIDDMKQMDQNALVRVLFASQQQQGFFDVVREFDYQEAFVF
jgi:hypothetical protein